MLAAFAPELPLTPLTDKIRNFVIVALEYILLCATVGFPLFFFQIFLLFLLIFLYSFKNMFQVARMLFLK